MTFFEFPKWAHDQLDGKQKPKAVPALEQPPRPAALELCRAEKRKYEQFEYEFQRQYEHKFQFAFCPKTHKFNYQTKSHRTKKSKRTRQ